MYALDGISCSCDRGRQAEVAKDYQLGNSIQQATLTDLSRSHTICELIEVIDAKASIIFVH